MNEQTDAEFLGLGPDGVQRGIGQFPIVDPIADRRAAQTLFLHCHFQLLHREPRVLQGQRCEGREPIGLRSHEFRQFLILDFDDLCAQIAIFPVPEGIDRQHFHVDGLVVHGFQTLFDRDEALGRTFHGGIHDGRVAADQGGGFVEDAMGVDVDGFNGLAIHLDRPAGLVRGVRGPWDAAAAKHDSARGGRGR